ncbi:MAG: isochorismatase family protein [Planctomycetota bacterium]|nr:isochorismatase family protein [Planctomycetota bacterium]
MRLVPANSLVCAVDIQEKLLAVMPAAEGVVSRSLRLATAAGLLGVPKVLTEQYPKGLGRTPQALVDSLPPAIEKISFSCCGCAAFEQAIPQVTEAVVLCGLETHVCITQTALDLLAAGYGVFVAVDAVASRHAIDHDIGLRRLEAAGAILTTTEAILFEWCRSADHTAFQAVRKLVIE